MSRCKTSGSNSAPCRLDATPDARRKKMEPGPILLLVASCVAHCLQCEQYWSHNRTCGSKFAWLLGSRAASGVHGALCRPLCINWGERNTFNICLNCVPLGIGHRHEGHCFSGRKHNAHLVLLVWVLLLQGCSCSLSRIYIKIRPNPHQTRARKFPIALM